MKSIELTRMLSDVNIRLTVGRYIEENVKTMRVVKEAEERRNEILDAAERLFETKGFDNTSISDILKETGIARGTLYYHFQSKEELLDAVIGRMIERQTAEARKIADRKEIPILQRFTMMMMIFHVNGGGARQEILLQVHKPQNALMHQKMQKRLFSGIVPLITALIEEGITQGICHTDYPTEAVEMTFLYANTAFDDLTEYGEKEKQRKIKAFIYHLERLFKMEQGSLNEAVMPLFESNAKYGTPGG